MIAYEVVVEVEPQLAERFVRFMRERHLPHILATGCFRAIRFEQASPTRWRSAYLAATRADLERYLDHHTAEMRADFQAHFPTGATVTRETWTLELLLEPE